MNPACDSARHIFRLSASAVAFLTAISAFAQEAAPSAGAAEPAAAVTAPAPAGTNAAPAAPAIEEIVVTAQRREQRLQDVPVAVTAVDAEALAAAHVDNISDIQAVSPSINFDVTNSASNSANIRIRGIGTVGNSRAFEGAVGVFVDGVYRTRAGQALQNWVDIDGLEVLRGPQGTLFGKNTSAGALIVNSKAPSLAGNSGDYELTFGNYAQILTRGAVNTVVSDQVAVRVAGMWQTMDGFIKDPNSGEDYNDRHPRALKAQVLWEPSDRLSLRLITDWSEEKANCCYGQVDAIDGPLQGYINGVLIPERGLQPPSSDFRDYEQVLSNNTLQQVEDKGAVLHADYRFESGDALHSVTAYRRWDISQMGMDADFTGANILTINETFATDFFSQEFTYNGKLGAFGPVKAVDYVLGAYYSHEDIFATYQLLWGDQAQEYFDTLLGAQGIPAGTAAAPEGLWHSMHFPAKSESSAAFMHWDFTISDAFSVIAGLRYSIDKKDGAYVRDYFTPLPNAAFTVLGAQPGPQFADSTDDSAVTGTFGLQYRFTSDVMAYATYSRGYKSGGVNIDNTAAGGVANNPDLTPGAVPLDPSYKPEFVDGYELGLKTEYWGRRARTNIALFYDDMTDLQVAQFSGTAFSVVNAPDATVYGAEIENNLLLTDFLNFNLAVTWLGKAQFGDSASIGIISGRDFAQAPELAGNASFDLNLPLTGRYSLTGRAAAQYSGKQYTNTSNSYQRNAQTEYNASVGVASSAGWSLSLWCQNCTDQRYTVQHFNSPLQGSDANAYVSAPLTYGLSLRASYAIGFSGPTIPAERRMPAYKAPIRDVQFCLNELHDFAAHYRDLEAAGLPGASDDDVRMIVDELARFAEDELAPLYRSGDAQGASIADGRVTSPDGFAAAYRRYVDMGWPRLAHPEAFGGQPVPYSLKLVAQEFMQAANQAWCMYALLNDGAIKTLSTFAADEQIGQFVPPLVSGQWAGTMCLTEPQCGSDLNLVRCRAEPCGDGRYRISGAKMFISSGEQDFTDNIVHLVLARLPNAPPGTRGISLFVVPKRLPQADGSLGEVNGMRALSIEHKMGLRGSATCVMSFEGSQGWLVGEPHRGLACMFVFINKSRLGSAVQAYAQAEASFQTALRYARERRAGQAPRRSGDHGMPADPLIEHPDVRRMLLTQKALAEGGRALTHYCARWVDLAECPDPARRARAERRLALLTPIAKGAISEWGSEAADLGVQVLGGHGYIAEWAQELRLRDVRVTRIYEGTTGIQGMDLLGRKVLGAQRDSLREFTQEILDFCQKRLADRTMLPLLERLVEAVQQWRRVSDELGELQAGDPCLVGAVAVDYLMLSGYVTLAYQWALAAAAASRRLDDSRDAAFHRAKLQTARFYFDKILPRMHAHREAIASGSAALMTLPSEHFSFDL